MRAREPPERPRGTRLLLNTRRSSFCRGAHKTQAGRLSWAAAVAQCHTAAERLQLPCALRHNLCLLPQSVPPPTGHANPAIAGMRSPATSYFRVGFHTAVGFHAVWGQSKSGYLTSLTSNKVAGMSLPTKVSMVSGRMAYTTAFAAGSSQATAGSAVGIHHWTQVAGSSQAKSECAPALLVSLTV